MKKLNIRYTSSLQRMGIIGAGQKAVKSLLVLGLGLSLQACEQEHLSQSGLPTISTKSVETNKLQTAFARVLVTALKTEPELRSFLKVEAAKQFNGDYDILYQMVKDKPVNSGESFHAHLAKYADATELAQIEEGSPLLTIFIPTLPGGFSPETWNAQAEIPAVAISLLGSNKIPFYDKTGEEQAVPSGSIPDFPILVIKQNERVTTELASTDKEENLGFFQNNKFSFRFIDKNFDNVHPKIFTKVSSGSKSLNTSKAPSSNGSTNRYSPLGGNIDNKVFQAWYNNGIDPNVQWQRDFIYYNISPYNDKGALDRNYREVIRTIKFTEAALGKMSDQTEGGSLKDPALQPSHVYYETTPNWWTDGNFELQVTVLINANNGIGPTINPIIPINPRDIFDIAYQRDGFFLHITSIKPKEFALEMPIVPWDLQTYGTGWKFVFVERDDSGTNTQTFQNSSSFGTNFSFDPTFSGVIKGGAKFGITTSTSSTITHSVVINLGDDVLCEAPLTFDRPIINDSGIITQPDGSQNFGYLTYEINDGPYSYISASVEPMRY